MPVNARVDINVLVRAVHFFELEGMRLCAASKAFEAFLIESVTARILQFRHQQLALSVLKLVGLVPALLLNLLSFTLMPHHML